MKPKKPTPKRRRLPIPSIPPIQPVGPISSISGDMEHQAELDRWKDVHNAKVARQQAAYDAWQRDNPEDA